MKKNVFIIGALMFSSLAFSQVGINTPNPLGTFHVDGDKDNPATGVPTAAQQGNDFIVTKEGNVGIGTTTPTSVVDINADGRGGGQGNDLYFNGFGNSIGPGLFLGSAQGNLTNPTNLSTDDIIGGVYFRPRIDDKWQHTSAGIRSIYKGDGTTNLTDLRFDTSNRQRAIIDENGNVGIATTTPVSTLDVVAKNATGTSTNVDGLLIPRVDRQRAQSMVDVPTSTLVYVNDVTTGTATGTAINIDVPGYYHFDGTAWNKLNSVKADTNIYNTNGTLTSNRTVTQGANSLAFTGTTSNAFSVDGNTFSVDAVNDRIGIGTVNPLAKLDIVGTTFGIKNSEGSGRWDNIWFNVGPRFPSINASGAEDGLQFNVGSNSFGTYGDEGQVLTTVATMLPSGNVGIGTTTPASRAVLELSSTDKGFLPPRLTTTQRDAIPAASRPAGLMIYNTNTNCMDFWNSSAWVSTCGTTTPAPGTVTEIICGSATNSGNLTSGVVASGVTSVIPYTGGNGGSHGGQTVTSIGVTGLTATLSAGSFANGNGNLTYIISGTPSATGTASFAINIGGRTCTLTRTVTGAVGNISGSINCGAAANNGTLTARVAATGVSSMIPYTGGNGGSHNGQMVTSTGVTGLTATLSAGNFANGNGTLTYTITGTPNTGGTANFVINIGGKTCTLSVNVAYNTTAPPAIVCTSAGYHVNPIDPNWFHYCIFQNNNWLQYVLRCADGQVFNQAQQKCVAK